MPHIQLFREIAQNVHIMQKIDPAIARIVDF